LSPPCSVTPPCPLLFVVPWSIIGVFSTSYWCWSCSSPIDKRALIPCPCCCPNPLHRKRKSNSMIVLLDLTR
jgi:hypothetical protein